MTILTLIALLLISLCVIDGKDITSSQDDAEWYAKKLASHETNVFSNSRVHVLRLAPGEDILDSIWKYARVMKVRAMSMISVVGSLVQTNIRYANQENGTSLNGHFELVSLVGTIDFQNTTMENYTGSGHIHIACANEEGVTIGGHALSGNVVYTTAEITMLEIMQGLFTRELDDGENGSGYYELKIPKQ